MVQSAWGYEFVYAAMGGVTLFMDRPTLAPDEILAVEPELNGADTVSVVSINADYEGRFSMPYSEILETFKTKLDEEIRDELDLTPGEKTGVELLRLPNDEHLPQTVKEGFFGEIDLAVVEATDVTSDGRVYLTTSIGASPTFLQCARQVIIEINRRQSPRLSEMADIIIMPPPPA